MKVVLLLLLAFSVFLGVLFAAASFYNWAWQTEHVAGVVRLVRPIPALVGLLAFVISVCGAFGPLLAIPLQNLGYLK